MNKSDFNHETRKCVICGKPMMNSWNFRKKPKYLEKEDVTILVDEYVHRHCEDEIKQSEGKDESII